MSTGLLGVIMLLSDGMVSDVVKKPEASVLRVMSVEVLIASAPLETSDDTL